MTAASEVRPTVLIIEHNAIDRATRVSRSSSMLSVFSGKFSRSISAATSLVSTRSRRSESALRCCSMTTLYRQVLRWIS